MSDQGTWIPTNFRYLTGQMLDAGLGESLLGGYVQRFVATAALKFGELVQLSSITAGEVITGTANLDRTVGVVVGGTNTVMEVLTDSALVGVTTVADAGESVLVQRLGTVRCILDTDDIGIGDLVKPSAITAGRVGKGVAGLTVDAGAVAVTSSAANGAIISGDLPAAPVIGISQTAETVAGNPILVVLRGLI